MAQKPEKTETVATLEALIAKVEMRLAHSADYIELMALKKAWSEIVAASPPLGILAAPHHGRAEKVVDDATGETLMIMRTGDFSDRRAPSQLEAARRVLSEAKEPLTTARMIERVRAVGATVGGKRPMLNLGSTLSRSEEFKSVRWKGEPAWWFKNKAIPPVWDVVTVAAE